MQSLGIKKFLLSSFAGYSRGDKTVHELIRNKPLVSVVNVTKDWKIGDDDSKIIPMMENVVTMDSYRNIIDKALSFRRLDMAILHINSLGGNIAFFEVLKLHHSSSQVPLQRRRGSTATSGRWRRRRRWRLWLVWET